MDNRIIIKPNSIKFYNTIVNNMEFIIYGFDEQHDNIPILIEISNSSGVIILKENFYKDFSSETILLVETAILEKNNEIQEKLKTNNIFFFEEPITEDKFIEFPVLFQKDGLQIKTKIIGFNKITNSFQLENFCCMVSIDFLFSAEDGRPLNDLLNENQIIPIK